MNFLFKDPTLKNNTSCIKMGNLNIPDSGGMNNAFIGHCNNNIDNINTREDFEKLSGILFNKQDGIFLTAPKAQINGMNISKNGNLELVPNGSIKIGGTEINEDDLKKLINYTRNGLINANSVYFPKHTITTDDNNIMFSLKRNPMHQFYFLLNGSGTETIGGKNEWGANRWVRWDYGDNKI